MINRRQLIQSGFAWSAASLAVLSALPAAVGATPPAVLRLERFVFDRRFAEAAEMAQHVAPHGIPLAATAGDVTDLWYDQFDLQWKKAPMALAGMTTRAGLFVLETLAADQRMRVVYRGEHAALADGRVAHALNGPAELIARVTAAPAAADWERVLGQALTHCPLGRLAPATLELRTGSKFAAARRETLYSWIIAPRSAAALLTV